MKRLLFHNTSLLCLFFLGMVSSFNLHAQWHDTIYFAAPYYGGSRESFGWHEFNDSLLLVPSSTEVGWGYIGRGMLNYYHVEGRKIQSAPLPNEIQANSNSETYYAGAFDSETYLSRAIQDSTVISFMSRLYSDTILWKAQGWLIPFLPASINFNGDQYWFDDSTSYLRMSLEKGDTFQVIAKGTLLPDSVGGVSFENYLSSGYSFRRADTLERIYSYYFYDTSDRKSKRSVAVLKYDLAQLRLLSVENYVITYSNSGRGEGVFEDEFVSVKDSLVPSLSDTTTERWLHVEKLSGERVRTVKMKGKFLRSSSNTYYLKASSVVNGKYTLVNEECYFKDTTSPSDYSESCSRVLLFGENNKLYYDRTFKGWGGLSENKVTKMTVNEKGEAYFRVTIASNPNHASMLVKLDTTGAHQLFELSDDTSIDPLIEVDVHPNPFQNSIQIETSRVGEYRFELYDLTGRLIKEWERQHQQFLIFNTENILPGIYLYRLEQKNTGKVLHNGKLIKHER